MKLVKYALANGKNLYEVFNHDEKGLEKSGWEVIMDDVDDAKIIAMLKLLRTSDPYTLNLPPLGETK